MRVGRRRWALRLALLLALRLAASLLAGCGMKGDPVAPELVQPLPVERLSATPAADGVALRWRRPTHYSGGTRMRDLERFEIQRAPAQVDRQPFALAGVLTLTDQQRYRQVRTLEWTDTMTTPGVGYWYRIVAVTSDGYRSPPSEPVFVRARTATTRSTTSTVPDPS
jgi:hypothetical protein